MDWTARHPFPPDASFDGGDLDCGNGLLLLIRRHIDPLEPGQLLEVRARTPGRRCRDRRQAPSASNAARGSAERRASSASAKAPAANVSM
jgi:hypothetical protein